MKTLKKCFYLNWRKSAVLHSHKDLKSCLRIWKCLRNWQKSFKAPPFTTAYSPLRWMSKCWLLVTGQTINVKPNLKWQICPKNSLPLLLSSLNTTTASSITVDSSTGNLVWARQIWDRNWTPRQDTNFSAQLTKCVYCCFLILTTNSHTNNYAKWPKFPIMSCRCIWSPW